MNPLFSLTELCHRFGMGEYVKAGGGNASFKNESSLFIKPSGTAMCTIEPENFAEVNRSLLRKLFSADIPDEPNLREQLVTKLLRESVPSNLRPSVETPLHELFDYAFVMHTHPTLVNGLTCSQNGETCCKELFPDALWIPYTDPGYKLFGRVREMMEVYSQTHAHQAPVLFMQNHGLLVAGETAEQVIGLHEEIIGKLTSFYRDAGIDLTLAATHAPSLLDQLEIERISRLALGENGIATSAHGYFPVAAGALTPDHIVYSKAVYFVGEVSKPSLQRFVSTYGYPPRVVATKSGVFGLGTAPDSARVALEMASDGALVEQLAKAFGGVRYLTRADSSFIENWEAEAYRIKVSAQTAKAKYIPVCTDKYIEQAYALARDRFASVGVDTEHVMRILETQSLSIQCWQGDDVGGFEGNASLSGGIMATGNHPGRARTAEDLRCDLKKALSLIPGNHRVNLHAMYAENTTGCDMRNALQPHHFAGWIDWARENKLGLDFNGTFFSHPKAADNFTLAHFDDSIRHYWVEHGIAAREIGEAMGRELGTPCIVNIWFPDGYKDTPVDRATRRWFLEKSLDAILEKRIDPNLMRDALEAKLFGIGTESFVAGSHEFCIAYALSRQIMPCLDMGHYHPTEQVADKISSLMPFTGELLLHLSRGVRWDSDHVVTFDNELLSVFQEVVRGSYLGGVHLALDYFDASINRIAAWVIGSRNALRALLTALLEPLQLLRAAERSGNLTARLALLEELKAYPVGAVWDYYCHTHGVPVSTAWIEHVDSYEKSVLAGR